MKLKYFLLATMFAFGFVACNSDDEKPEIEKPVKGKADLTVRLKGVATKADGDVADAKIFLYNDAGELEATAALGTLHDDMPSDIGSPIVSTCMEELTPGDKKLIVIANTAGLGLADEMSLDDILAAKYVATDPYEATENAIMSSQVYDITLYEGTHTLYGFPTSGEGYPDDYTLMSSNNPIKLYRLVSKVYLDKVTLKESEKYPDPELTINEVYVLRASAESKLAAPPQWGETYSVATNHFYGVEKERFDNDFWAIEKDNEILYIHTYNPETYTSAYKSVYSLFSSSYTLTVSDNTRTFGSTFFTYENTDTQNWTLLVLHGDYSFQPADTDSRVVMKDRYYIIRIGDPDNGADFSQIVASDDFPGRETHAGMYRNVQYLIDATITGPGSAGSISEMQGDASLDVAMKVVDYGQVTQKPEF